MHEDVLRFWFEDIGPQQWFSSDPDVDARIRERFGSHLDAAAAGELHAWRKAPGGRLAEIIVLDQFSRNVFRGTPRAFAQDPTALVLSQEAVAGGVLAQLDSPMQRSFLLMPFMHSESRHIHETAETLFREHAPDNNVQYELRHKAIIDRFGRYPHRNAILGRTSTPEERAFLEQPDSSF